ncbi:hypothetical protein RIF29_30111 [Crotalaria pallida]|uniref:Transmembrane protein n=1 Tax=Crotalaria pallida TaxID=3830 RepID=A0AAN9HWH0_CROPI
MWKYNALDLNYLVPQRSSTWRKGSFILNSLFLFLILSLHFLSSHNSLSLSLSLLLYGGSLPLLLIIYDGAGLQIEKGVGGLMDSVQSTARTVVELLMWSRWSELLIKGEQLQGSMGFLYGKILTYLPQKRYVGYFLLNCLILFVRKLLKEKNWQTYFVIRCEKQYMEEVQLRAAEEQKNVDSTAEQIAVTRATGKAEARWKNVKDKSSNSSSTEQDLDTFLL